MTKEEKDLTIKNLTIAAESNRMTLEEYFERDLMSAHDKRLYLEAAGKKEGTAPKSTKK